MSLQLPTSSFTFRDLVLRVAEYLGVAYYGSSGTESAQVPTDAHDLDMCKRLVNDGIRMFVAANAKWRWMRKTYSLTLDADGDGPYNVAGDAGRYVMPPDFNGDASKDWTFGAGENVPPFIQVVPESYIRRQRSIGSDQSGIPYWAAFRRLNQEDLPKGLRASWEVIFYPEPGSAYVVEYQYRSYFDKLVDLDLDRHYAGAEFDEVVQAACLAKAELDRDDTMGARHEVYRQCLADAIVLDRQSAPKNLGQNLDASGRGRAFNRAQLGFDRPTQRVTYNVAEE